LTVFPVFAVRQSRGRNQQTAFALNLLWGLLRSRGYFVLDLCGFAGAEMTEQGFYMSAVKNGVVLRNKKSLYYA
jgi:hypothetical protein